MSSGTAPQLVGVAAAILLLAVIGVVPAAVRPLERIRLWRRRGDSAGPEAWTRTQASVPQAPSPLAVPASAVEAEEDDTSPLPVTAELQSEELRREPEAEATRMAEDARRQAQELHSDAQRISEDAQLRARELLGEAELEAKRIVVAAGRERARLLSELDQEQEAMAERRTRLDSLSTIQEA